MLLQDCRLIYRNLVPEHLYLMESGYVALMDFRFARRDDGALIECRLGTRLTTR